MKRRSEGQPKTGTRRNDFPELQVGFPERNDASNPIDDMERIHVDLETMNISRTNTAAFTREITSHDADDKK